MNGFFPLGIGRARAIAALAIASMALLAAFGATAQASSVTLRCAGRGPRNRDSADTTLCASSPKGRTIAGVVKDDAGKPVAARLSVTYSRWIPTGDSSFSVKVYMTKEVAAKGDGSFSFASNPATKESIRVDVVADEALGVSGGAFAEAEVSRRLVVRIAKLGGGMVRFTVTGTRHRPLKVYVLDSSGYQLSGIKPKNANGRGQATFDLHTLPAGYSLTYFVDAGDSLNDLFWYQSRVPFRR
jgi:hypothetical protein